MIVFALFDVLDVFTSFSLDCFTRNHVREIMSVEMRYGFHGFLTAMGYKVQRNESSDLVDSWSRKMDGGREPGESESRNMREEI